MDIADLHNHLVPAVDDGARTLEESLRHLTALHADGVTHLATSSHLFGWLMYEDGALRARIDELKRAFDALAEVCAKRSDVPVLRFSQEILIGSVEIAERVFQEPDVGLAGTRYALVEFGFDLEHEYADVIRAIMRAGRQPIISHPERFRRNTRPVTYDEILSWKQAGALLQVNGGSVLGQYGEAIEQTAWRLIERGDADLISSDHHADARRVSPRAVFESVAARAGNAIARRLMCENTHRILSDQPTLALERAGQSAA